MYYWLSWVIHIVLILSVAVFLGILLRYNRLKPKITKTSKKPQDETIYEIKHEEQDDGALDLNTLYKSRNER